MSTGNGGSVDVHQHHADVGVTGDLPGDDRTGSREAQAEVLPAVTA